MNGIFCRCSEQLAPIATRRWRIRGTKYRNPNTGRASNNCQVICLVCLAPWRTAAAYVDDLKYMTEPEKQAWYHNTKLEEDPNLAEAWAAKQERSRKP